MIATSCSDLEPDEFNSMFDGLPRYNFVMIDNQPVVPELVWLKEGAIFVLLSATFCYFGVVPWPHHELKYRRNFDVFVFPG